MTKIKTETLDQPPATIPTYHEDFFKIQKMESLVGLKMYKYLFVKPFTLLTLWRTAETALRP